MRLDELRDNGQFEAYMRGLYGQGPGVPSSSWWKQKPQRIERKATDAEVIERLTVDCETARMYRDRLERELTEERASREAWQREYYGLLLALFAGGVLMGAMR